MISIVLNNVLKHKLISKGDNIVVGLSGGPDSMALLYCLCDIQKDLDFNIIAAHVNHGVRGEDAKADQDFCQRICKSLEIEFHTINVDMYKHGKEMGITAEEAGRELRYGFFRELLRQNGGGKIAVAHNKNDQAETLIMRIMRGTGIDGLKGMEFNTNDIIRPILNISREDIEEYIRNNNIETVLDKTNLLPIYSRNKIRLELIPYMEKNFNPNIIDSLWRLSQTVSVDAEFLNQYTNERFNKLAKINNNNSISIVLNKFAEESLSIKQRLLRMTINKLLGTLQGFSAEHISSILDLVTKDTGKQLNLPLGIIARISYDTLFIERYNGNNTNDFHNKLKLGDNFFPELNLLLKLYVIDNYNGLKMGNDIKYFDYSKISGDLYIRNRKDGDRFIPLGMEGSKKIKDYFIDKKIPREIRDITPLLVDNENIIWIIGFGISNLYKVTEETKKILVIEYKKAL